MIFRPILGEAVQLSQVRYPIVASPKLDGIRTLGIGNELRSRTLKLIPNQAIQELFSGSFEAWDGELVSGDPTAPDVFNRTTSQVMTRGASANGITWYLFDHFSEPDNAFIHRLTKLPDEVMGGRIKKLPQRAIWSEQELLAYEEEQVSLGFEGLILRDPTGPYKMGRSTVKEGYLLKLKRFVDDEAPVIGFEELLHNANQSTIDERGYTKRSSHIAAKIPAGTLGALIVQWRGQNLNLGTGFTADDRRTIWENQSHYLGRLAKFKYLPTGMKDLPRHPVWLGWRHPDDT